jgi:predicted Zn finger-like uncharacterized protein
MKLTCGGCDAKYSMGDHKIAGKIVRIRCRKCGEIIVANGARGDAGGEVCAVPEGPGATPRIAQRNEESVLFSLSALGQTGATETPPVGEQGAGPSADPSGLIDIRRLARARKTASVRPRLSDDIAHLGVLISPILSPGAPGVVAAPNPRPPSSRPWLFVFAGLIVSLSTIVALLLQRPVPSVALQPVLPPATPSVSAPVIDSQPPATTTAEAVAVAVPPPAPPPPHRTTPRAPPARRPAVVATPTPEPAPTPTLAAARCCPGEAPTDCEIRRSVGAACSG